MIADKITISGQLPPDDPYRRDLYEPFRALLKKQYGASAEPSEYQGVAYDGIMVAIDAIKTAGTDDRAAVRNALERIRWEGFAGAFACTPSDHQGSPTDNSPAVIVRNGAYVPYKK
jgi:branched-chain amino acid transport system substrate-binding protein